MTNERLEQIRDSIDFQLSAEKNLKIDKEVILEEKELLDYITNLEQKVEQYENPEDMTLFYMWLDEKAKDKLKQLEQENERLKKDLHTLWNVCWNNDTEMTSYQNEIFDNYYDEFHKQNGGDEE